MGYIREALYIYICLCYPSAGGLFQVQGWLERIAQHPSSCCLLKLVMQLKSYVIPNDDSFPLALILVFSLFFPTRRRVDWYKLGFLISSFRHLKSDPRPSCFRHVEAQWLYSGMQKIYTSIPVDIKKINRCLGRSSRPTTWTPWLLLPYGERKLAATRDWPGPMDLGNNIFFPFLSIRWDDQAIFRWVRSIISPLPWIKKWARRKSRPSARYLSYLESPVVIPYTDFFFSRCCWWEVRSLAISRLSVGYMYVSCTALDMEGHPHVNLSQGLPCQRDRKGP